MRFSKRFCRSCPRWLVSVAGACVLFGCAEEVPPDPPIRPVLALQVPEQVEVEMRRFPGRAQASRVVNLSFRVAGPLITLPVQIGDTVEAGRVLASIDPNEFEQRIRNVSAQLDEARTRLELAEEEFARAETAAERGGVSEVEVIRKRADVDSAAAAVQSLEASLQTAEDELRYTELRAPFSGRVVAQFVENFEDVQAKQEILRLVDDDIIEMTVDVPEGLIGRARFGSEVNVVFDALPGIVLDAVVKEIGTEASEVTRTYPVTLSMEQPEGEARVLPGMTGRAWPKQADDPPDGALLPLSALTGKGEERSVWVVDEQGGTVSRRVVEVGELFAEGVLVSGLEAGEWVAVKGANYLREGQRVRLEDVAAEASE